MQAPEISKAGPQGKTRIRILKLAVAIVAVLIVLAFFLVPAFVSSEKGREIILAKINDSVQGQIDFASLSMIWSEGIKVTDVSFSDSTGRTSVKIKRITTKPHYLRILMGGLSFGETIIDNGNLKVTDRRTAETVEVTAINSSLTMNFPRRYSSGRAEKMLANLNAKGKLGFEKAGYMGLNFGPTELAIQIRKGLLKIAPFSTTANNGEFSFAGQADFKQKPPIFETQGPIQIAKDIQINDETTEKLLMYMNPIFAKAVNVSGVASFNCERLAIPLSAANQNDIEIIGTISINQLRLQASDLLSQILSTAGTTERGQTITIRPTRFVLQNGFLRYDDMQMDIGDNPVNFKGVIGLDKTLNMTVTLPYTFEGRTARIGKETVGERISLPLRGTIDKPELDVDRLLEEQLKLRLQQEIIKGLDKLLK